MGVGVCGYMRVIILVCIWLGVILAHVCKCVCNCNILFPLDTVPPLNLQCFTSDPLINLASVLLVLLTVFTPVVVESSINY